MGQGCAKPNCAPEHLRPHGLYNNSTIDVKRLRRRILDGKLAACWAGVEQNTPSQMLEECPICFLFYPALNRAQCCAQSVCTECYLQVESIAGAPCACPFCKADFSVAYRGLRTASERASARHEEQRLIEAQLQARANEEALSKRQRAERLARAAAELAQPSAFAPEPAQLPTSSSHSAADEWPAWASSSPDQDSSWGAPSLSVSPLHSPTASGRQPRAAERQARFVSDKEAEYVPSDLVSNFGSLHMDLDLNDLMLMKAMYESMQESHMKGGGSQEADGCEEDLSAEAPQSQASDIPEGTFRAEAGMWQDVDAAEDSAAWTPGDSGAMEADLASAWSPVCLGESSGAAAAAGDRGKTQAEEGNASVPGKAAVLPMLVADATARGAPSPSLSFWDERRAPQTAWRISPDCESSSSGSGRGCEAQPHALARGAIDKGAPAGPPSWDENTSSNLPHTLQSLLAADQAAKAGGSGRSPVPSGQRNVFIGMVLTRFAPLPSPTPLLSMGAFPLLDEGLTGAPATTCRGAAAADSGADRAQSMDRQVQNDNDGKSRSKPPALAGSDGTATRQEHDMHAPLASVEAGAAAEPAATMRLAEYGSGEPAESACGSGDVTAAKPGLGEEQGEVVPDPPLHFEPDEAVLLENPDGSRVFVLLTDDLLPKKAPKAEEAEQQPLSDAHDAALLATITAGDAAVRAVYERRVAAAEQRNAGQEGATAGDAAPSDTGATASRWEEHHARLVREEDGWLARMQAADAALTAALNRRDTQVIAQIGK